MNEEYKNLNVYQKINSIMQAVSYVQKTGSIQVGKGSYSAVLHDHVTQLVQPHFVNHGLVVEPKIVEHEFERYSVVTKYGEADRYECKVKVVLNVINADNPEERITVDAIAIGIDSQDKAPGKAYSMAIKYCYLKLLMLASGDQEEDRVEEAKIIKKNTMQLREELTELLKANGKYNSEAEVLINKLSGKPLLEAIARNKESKNE